MGNNVPKQFIYVLGHPLVAHTLLQLHDAVPEADICLALPKKYISFWKKYCAAIHLPSHHIVCGGDTRSASVQAVLTTLKQHTDEQLVAIHDGVRPFISKHVLVEGFAMAKHKGSAVPMVPVSDALRKKQGLHTIDRDRSLYYLVQTPQIFKLGWLRQAFQRIQIKNYVDEASIIEASGYPIHPIKGAIENIKITYPIHLKWAEVHLKSSATVLNTRLR